MARRFAWGFKGVVLPLVPLLLLLLLLNGLLERVVSLSCSDTCTENFAFVDFNPACTGNCYNQCGDDLYCQSYFFWELEEGPPPSWSPDQFLYYPRLNSTFDTTFVTEYDFSDSSSYCSQSNGCRCHCTPSASGCRLCSSGIQDPVSGTSYWDAFIPSATRIQTDNGCVDSLFNLNPPDFMYVNFTLSSTDNVIVNCRLRVCGSGRSDVSGCVSSNYSCHEVIYHQDRCNCNSDTSNSNRGFYLPNWYCTIQAPNDVSQSIDTRINNGRDVDVICIPNANFNQDPGSGGSGTASHICLNVSTNVILSVGPWPAGVYLVTNGLIPPLEMPVFSPQFIPDWGCTSADACSQLEPELFYFKTCSSTIQNTMFPDNTPPFNVQFKMYEVCEWQALQDPSGSTGARSISLLLDPGLGDFSLVSQLYSNLNLPTIPRYMGAQSVCYHVSYLTGSPVIDTTDNFDNQCVLDSRMNTVVLYPDVTSANFQIFLDTNPPIPTMINGFFAMNVTYGEQDPLLSYFGPPFYDSFANTPLQNPTLDSQKVMMRVFGFAKLTLNHTFNNNPYSSVPRSWTDPGYSSYFANNGPIRNTFLHAYIDETNPAHEIIYQTRGTGSMYWTRQDVTDCSRSSNFPAGTKLYYVNTTGASGCFPIGTFCEESHCTCTQEYFFIPVDPADQSSYPNGKLPTDQDFSAESVAGGFNYNTNIQCESQYSSQGVFVPIPPNSGFGASCSAMKVLRSTLTVGSNTTCKCLANTGWNGQRCDVCDPLQLVPWFNQVTCSITCRSPDESVIGHAACQNGALCVYNSGLNEGQCACSAGFTGPYCQFPRNLSLSCDQGRLPFQCTVATTGTTTLLANYLCYLNSQGVVLPDGFVVHTFLSAKPISFSPPNVTDGQMLWRVPLVPSSQRCSVLHGSWIDSIVETATSEAPPQLLFYCPLPYNTLVSGYNAMADIWCTLSSHPPSFFYWFDALERYIYSCFVVAQPVNQVRVNNTGYTWCHSNPLLTGEGKLQCRLAYSLSTYPALPSGFTYHQLNTLLDAQCNEGTLASQDIFASTDNCDFSSCVNGGVCTSASPLSGNYTCTCPPLFNGVHCEQLVNKCPSLNPCQNNGTCLPGIPLGSYTCVCNNASFGSTNCTVPNQCVLQNNPCQNGGVCTPIYFPTSNFTCTCPLHYSGDLCATIDACAIHPSSCYPAVCVTGSGGGNACEQYTPALNYSGEWHCSSCAIYASACLPGTCVDFGVSNVVDAWTCTSTAFYECECPLGYHASGSQSCQPDLREALTISLTSFPPVPACPGSWVGSTTWPCRSTFGGQPQASYPFQYVPISASTIAGELTGFIFFAFTRTGSIGSSTFTLRFQEQSQFDLTASLFFSNPCSGPYVNAAGTDVSPNNCVFPISETLPITNLFKIANGLIMSIDTNTADMSVNLIPHVCTGIGTPVAACQGATTITLLYY